MARWQRCRKRCQWHPTNCRNKCVYRCYIVHKKGELLHVSNNDGSINVAVFRDASKPKPDFLFFSRISTALQPFSTARIGFLMTKYVLDTKRPTRIGAIMYCKFFLVSHVNATFWSPLRRDRLADPDVRPRFYPGFFVSTYSITNWWENVRLPEFHWCRADDFSTSLLHLLESRINRSLFYL